MQRHLGDRTLADRFISLATVNSLEHHVYQRDEDAEAIDKLSRALREVELLHDERISVGAIEAIHRHVVFGPHAETMDDVAARDYLTDTGIPAAKAMGALHENIKVLRPALGAAIQDIESSSVSLDLRRTNIFEISLVDAARQIWEQVTGGSAPKSDLNEATPFADFLDDVFWACGATGQPRSALRAWGRLVSR